MEEGEVLIYSITGQKMLQQHYTSGQVLDLSKLDAGMYVVYGYSVIGDFVEKLNLVK
jgi:hypothetical protein